GSQSTAAVEAQRLALSGFEDLQNPLKLPVPTASPSDPHADVPVVDIGRIAIPRIGLDTPLYEGIWETVIDVGPGHWPGTAKPGGWGNTVIAGHQVTYGHPFRELGQLVPGDQIIVSTSDGTFNYAVTETFVVDPSAVWIADQESVRTLTLFTCHPPGSEAFRYVVRAELVY
ncbi:MAG: class E sortase, partial [Acidimicrobiia bacterium]|nr:class E sortase [Acidimicrobiia bacterium]